MVFPWGLLRYSSVCFHRTDIYLTNRKETVSCCSALGLFYEPVQSEYLFATQLFRYTLMQGSEEILMKAFVPEMDVERRPKGIARPCWGMITELWRIKMSSPTHTHTLTLAHWCMELWLQRHPVLVCMHPPRWPAKIQTKRERRGASEENKLTASSLFLLSFVGSDIKTWQPSRLLYLHGCHFISMSFTGRPGRQEPY